MLNESYKIDHYPWPRQPEYLTQSQSNEYLRSAAKRDLERTVGRGALGRLKPGDNVLIVTPEVPKIQDPNILNIFIKVLKEKGIQATAISEVEVGTTTTLEEDDYLNAEDGWKEIFWREENTAMLPTEIQRQRPTKLINTMIWNPEGQRPLREFMQKHKEFNAVYVGIAGRDDYRYALLEEGSKFKDNWIYHTSASLLSKENDFPDEVWKMVEEKTVKLLSQVKEVRVTDPQGTELWWAMNKEEAKLWAEMALHTGHLYMYPPAVRGSLCDEAWLRGKVEEVFYFPKAQGVIASTTNHVGTYEHMRAYVDNGIVYKIEGGGLFGELIRIILAKTKDIHYPYYPEPGYLYVTEGALGTNPKSFRSRNMLHSDKWFPNVGERNRSGVIHWGFGIHTTTPAIVEWAKQRNLPKEHGMHMHSLFATYSIKLRDTNEWHDLIKKGRLVALDDPQVIALASQYGEPKDILSEDWIPTIPGINYPGDYMKHYGENPGDWLRRELIGKLPMRMGVPD